LFFPKEKERQNRFFLNGKMNGGAVLKTLYSMPVEKHKEANLSRLRRY